MTDRDAILAAVRLAPHDDTARLVAADWFFDHDEPRVEAELRWHPPGNESDGSGGGGGSGGSGSGGGSDGGGYGGDGYGGYDGSGGDGGGGDGGDGGDGDGGDGDGGGDGYGGGDDRFKPNQGKGAVVMRDVGDKVLVLVPGSYRNYAYVGRVGECVGAHTYRLLDASMVMDSGAGADWMALARGDDRSGARFSKAPGGEVDIGPQFGGVFLWVGELP